MPIQICPVCSVRIEDNDKVLFSAGPPGTRSRLYARVCQFAKKADCINSFDPKTEPMKNEDFYK